MIPSLVTSLATAGFVFAMVYAGIVDLTTMRIRNGLVLALLAAYVALAPLAGFTLEEIAWSAAIAAGLLVVSFVFFARGWMGGGDAKLLAVTALWLGFDHTPAFLVYTALFGGALTLAILQLRLVVLPAFLGNRPWIAQLQSDKAGIPYGVAITIAALVVFPQTRWFAL
ncbi:prepilin peptidase [Reyranella sp.]|uniref:A24 family peptidase n=1 Tax=Reyranella sp. TaxID=1929291 RepID=UPI0027303FC2|nr:prepilin peptidase [Reyranella sp.]MDP2378606.1 prepilin peptidase [Reyranella sp.]